MTTLTNPESASPLLKTSIRHSSTTLESTFIALAGYAGATLILTYHIASHSPHGALAIFKACRRTANELEGTNGYTEANPTDAISAINKILHSTDTTAHIMLLVDIIRIANHITKS